MDDNVNIGLIEQYFEDDVYLIAKDAGNKQ